LTSSENAFLRSRPKEERADEEVAEAQCLGEVELRSEEVLYQVVVLCC
jgi:hypothetical protein